MTNTKINLIDEQHRIEEIKENRTKKGKRIIEFRNDKATGNPRISWMVPTEYLSFRKDNARILAEVKTYEKSKGPIQELTKEGQIIIGGLLTKSDPKNMDLLKTLLEAHGQEEPAVATASGRLLNGNRRLRALNELYNDPKTKDEKYKYMEVVILPSGNPEDGYGDGAKPSEKEIQALEYSYQVRRTGRSEYTGLNLALMYRNNIQNRGITLEELLKEDPEYMNLNLRKFNAAVRKINQDSLESLEEFDNYLEYFDRKGMYSDDEQSGNISDGRWQAFIDWTKTYRTIKDENNFSDYNITANDLGKIKAAAYKLIRQQELHTAGKVHEFMRKIPKALKNKHTKKKLFELSDETKYPSDIPETQKKDKDGKAISNVTIDAQWGKNNGSKITNIAQKINTELTYGDAVSRPVRLLEQALEKLNHDNMSSEVLLDDNAKCMELCMEIIDKADDLHTDFDKNRMKLDALASMGN